MLGFLGLFGNPLLIFIAIFIYLAASSEAHLVAIRAMARGVPVTSAMLTKFASLTPDEHIDTAVETSLQTSQGEFPVVDGMGRPVGLLARNDLIRALKERGPDARVADAMTSNIPTVNNRRCLDEAFRLLQEKSAPAVAVVDTSERLVGLVTSETIGRMLMLHQALPSRGAVRPLGAIHRTERRYAGALNVPPNSRSNFRSFGRSPSDLHAAHTASRYNARVQDLTMPPGPSHRPPLAMKL